MDKRYIPAEKIKAEALRLGFSACGIARAEVVPTDVCKRYETWLHAGRHASMAYLEHHLEKRFDPRLLVEGTRSIVSVALNYYPRQLLPLDRYQFAWYAYGKDYHDVMKARLNELLTRLQTQFCSTLSGRAFCDTAPVLERYWAWRAGLGQIGRHTQLIIPRQGTAFFLGELFLNAETEYDVPLTGNPCSTCKQCQQACPTTAILPDGTIDAHRCLSYLTIENRGEILPEFAAKMGNCIYGCDRCQQACPHNQYATPTQIAEFLPSARLMQMMPADWHALTLEQYRGLFNGSAVKRAKFEGLTRNIAAVEKKF